MDKSELRLFNPFLISQADSKEIATQYEILQNRINETADTPYQIADNIEIYANMNYLIGEMIARIQQEHDILKADISITENKQVYMARKQWQETNTEKAPAITYFEAMAKEYIKEDSKKLAELGARLFRFKKAFESIEAKQNALKKKIEAIKYET